MGEWRFGKRSALRRKRRLLGVALLLAGSALLTHRGQPAASALLPLQMAEQRRPTAPIPVAIPDTLLNARLLKAVQEGDLEAARALLAEGASADARIYWQDPDDEGTPLAVFAANLAPLAPKERQPFLPLFQLLLAHITDPNASDRNGNTLLMAAVEMDDLASVKRLVRQGANVNAGMKRLFTGANALYFAAMLGGNRGKDPSPITLFLLAQKINVNCQDEAGDTPLMAAAQFGKKATVKALLARGADPSLRNQRGWTALRWASLAGKEDVVQILSDVTPMGLLESAEFGKEARVRACLDAGENPNTPDATGTTPLIAAMKSQNAAIVTLLLDRGAQVGAKDKSGKTALHYAALYGDSALAKILLERGADVNAAGSPSPSVRFSTPLLCAVDQAQADMVDLLLTRGVSLAQNEQGAWALEKAVSMAGQRPRRPREAPGRKPFGDAFLDAEGRIVERLLEAGVDARSHHSRALTLAASNAQIGLVTLLIEKGADVNERGVEGPLGSGDDGETVLMGAIGAWIMAHPVPRSHKKGGLPGLNLHGSRELENNARATVTLLLAKGADVNAADRNGKTPLMQCQECDLFELAKTLLAHHADINAADGRGRTALMQAAAEDDLPMAQWLLAQGADVNRRDKEGRTTLILAQQNDFSRVVTLLRQNGAK